LRFAAIGTGKESNLTMVYHHRQSMPSIFSTYPDGHGKIAKTTHWHRQGIYTLQ
jgi:hypothetical protein